MAVPRATFEGFGELAAKLRDLTDPKQIGPVLRKGVRDGMAEPMKQAKALIAVGTEPHLTYKGKLVAPGFAQRSIVRRTKVDRSGLSASCVLGVLDEAFYAVAFLELGTSKMAARPWLRPAFAANRDPAIRALGADLNAWILDVAKRSKSPKRQQQLLTNVSESLASFEGGS